VSVYIEFFSKNIYNVLSMPHTVLKTLTVNSNCCYMYVLTVNSSAMKRTLRTNNRELARALELKKSELSLAQNEQMKLRLENQAQLQELIQLRACTNMQNIADFEREVKRRVDVSPSSYYRCFLSKTYFSFRWCFVENTDLGLISKQVGSK